MIAVTNISFPQYHCTKAHNPECVAAAVHREFTTYMRSAHWCTPIYRCITINIQVRVERVFRYLCRHIETYRNSEREETHTHFAPSEAHKAMAMASVLTAVGGNKTRGSSTDWHAYATETCGKVGAASETNTRSTHARDTRCVLIGIVLPAKSSGSIERESL